MVKGWNISTILLEVRSSLVSIRGYILLVFPVKDLRGFVQQGCFLSLCWNVPQEAVARVIVLVSLMFCVFLPLRRRMILN